MSEKRFVISIDERGVRIKIPGVITAVRTYGSFTPVIGSIFAPWVEDDFGLVPDYTALSER